MTARFGIQIDDDNGHHVRFRLFAATGGEHLGGCGQLTMRAAEYAAFRELLASALTDRSDPAPDATRPPLERVTTDDWCFRVFEPKGIGTGALTYDPHGEVLEVDWLPPQHRSHGVSAAQICAGILDLHGDDALWRHLEQTYWQLKTATGGA